MRSVMKMLAVFICIAAVSADFNLGSGINGLRKSAHDVAEKALEKGREVLSHFHGPYESTSYEPTPTTPAVPTDITPPAPAESESAQTAEAQTTETSAENTEDVTPPTTDETLQDEPVPLVLPVDIVEDTPDSAESPQTPQELEPETEPQCVNLELGVMTYWWTQTNKMSLLGNYCDGLSHGEIPANHTRACIRTPHEITGSMSVFVTPVADAPQSSLTGCQMVVSQKNLTDEELRADPCGTSPSDSFCVPAQISPSAKRDVMFNVPATRLLAWEEKFVSFTCAVSPVGAGLFSEPAKEIGESTQPTIVTADVEATQFGSPSTRVVYLFQSTKGNTMDDGVNPTSVGMEAPEQDEVAIIDNDSQEDGEASFTMYVQETAGEQSTDDIVVKMQVMGAKPCHSFRETVFNGLLRFLGLGINLEQSYCEAKAGDKCTLDLPAHGSFIVGIENIGTAPASIKVFSGKISMEHVQSEPPTSQMQEITDWLNGMLMDSSEDDPMNANAEEPMTIDLVPESEQQEEAAGVIPAAEGFAPMMLDVDEHPQSKHVHDHKHSGIHHKGRGMALWKWGAIAGAIALSILLGALAFHCVRKRRLEQELIAQGEPVRASYVNFVGGLESDYQPL